MQLFYFLDLNFVKSRQYIFDYAGMETHCRFDNRPILLCTNNLSFLSYSQKELYNFQLYLHFVFPFIKTFCQIVQAASFTTVVYIYMQTRIFMTSYLVW